MTDPVSEYMTTPTLPKPNFSGEMVVVAPDSADSGSSGIDSSIEIYATPTDTAQITSVAGTVGYGPNSIFSFPGGYPIMLLTGAETPPMGYVFPKGQDWDFAAGGMNESIFRLAV